MTSVEALVQAAAGFVVADVDLVAEPAAAAAAQRSLDGCGLLLLGEMHGARENPLLARALMQAFGITRLALEWDEGLAPVIEALLATGTLADHWLLWSGDGRITAGHLAVLAERATAGPLQVILSDGATGAEWDWSACHEAMARRILAAAPAGTRTLAVAGNAHTPTGPTGLGVPMGATLDRRRPGRGRSASTTAAGGTTTPGRGGSPTAARGRTRSGFTSTTTRSFSTFPTRRRRSCPAGPRGDRPRPLNPDGGITVRCKQREIGAKPPGTVAAPAAGPAEDPVSAGSAGCCRGEIALWTLNGTRRSWRSSISSATEAATWAAWARCALPASSTMPPRQAVSHLADPSAVSLLTPGCPHWDDHEQRMADRRRYPPVAFASETTGHPERSARAQFRRPAGGKTAEMTAVTRALAAHQS